MIRKPWLPVIGACLLSVGLFLAWRAAAPAERADGGGGGAAAGGTVADRHSPAGSAGTRSRPPRDGAAQPAEVARALAELEAASEEELAERAGKRAADWPKDALPAAVEALFAAAEDSPAATALGIELLRRWATLSPAAAAAWAASLADGAARRTAVDQVALAWSATDAQAAWDWAAGLPTGEARDAALLSLAYELARDNPALAFERATDLAEGPDRLRLVEHAVSNWALTDPQAALDRVRQIDDPALRNANLGRLATSWAESDPRRAATLAVDAMDAGAEQERAVAAIVQRWAQRDPAGVGAWVATFPEGPIKQNALEHIAEQSPKPEAPSAD